MAIEHQRTAHVARSGDTHVIDPSVDHAEAVNVDATLPSRLREGLGEGMSPSKEETDPPLTPPASGRGIKAAKPDAPLTGAQPTPETSAE